MRYRALVTALVLISTPVVAGNLLVNPTFDTDLSGWDYVGPDGQWQAPDALGLAGSGSLIATNDFPGATTYFTLLASSCIALTPGAHYDGSFDYRIAAGQGATALPFLEVAWYGAGGCNGGNFLGNVSLVEGNVADGVWHRREAFGGFTPPANAAFASIRVDLAKIEAGGSVTAEFDNLVFKPEGTCGTTPDRLCINNDRFQVTANFLNYAGQSGVAKAKSMTGDTGYFWFFSPSNVEVVIKVINGCNFNSNYWIYAGGLTDVQVDLEVKDTRTGTVVPFANALGTPFPPIGVIGDLPVCP